MRQAGRRLISTTSFFGLVKIVNSEKPLIKLLWSLAVASISTFGIYIIFNNIADYYNYDVITNTRMIEQKSAIFPAISFCAPTNTNGMLSIHSAFWQNSTNTRQIAASSFQYSGRCVRFSDYQNDSRTFTQVDGIGLSHSVNIDIKTSSPVTIYFTDNYLKSNENSVQLVLDPATNYYIFLSKTVDSKLAEPFNPCSSRLDKDYRHLNCKQECIYEQVAEKFNCNYLAYGSFVSNQFTGIPKCITNLSDYEFSIKKAGLFGDYCESLCPKECMTTKFDTKVKLFRSKDRQSPANLSSFVIFFEDLHYLDFSQIPKISEFTLLSNIGGALGAFLGLQFLSVVELIEFLIEGFIVLVHFIH